MKNNLNRNRAELPVRLGILLCGVVLVLAGCGGGSSSRDRVLVGVLNDAAVAGVSYSTATQSGVTNERGEYQYRAGERLTFTLGDLALGSAPAQAEVTLFDLADISTPPTNSDEVTEQLIGPDGLAGPLNRVINLAMVLQSLDSDNNADNGIVIEPDVAAMVTAEKIDLNTHYWEVQQGGNLRDARGLPGLIRAATEAGRLTARPVVKAGTALNHVYAEQNLPMPISVFGLRSQDSDGDGLPDSQRRIEYAASGNVLQDSYDSDGDGIFERVYEYTYNANNFRSGYTRDDDGDGSAEFTEVLEYDPFGSLLRREQLDGNRASNLLETLALDEDGRLIRREFRNSSNHNIQYWMVDENGLRSLYELDSDGDGNIDSRSTLYYADGETRSDRWIGRDIDSDLNGTFDGRWERSFDDRGRLLTDRRDLDLDGMFEYDLSNTYDDFGQTSYRFTNGGNTRHHRWTRDDQGNLLTQESDNNGDGAYENVTRYTYDANNQRIRQQTETNGLPVTINHWTFNAQGQQISRDLDSDANGTIDRRYVYEYNGDGLLIRNTVDRGNDGTIDETTDYSEWTTTGFESWL